MKKRTTLGIVTIGQSPRDDVVPEMKRLAAVEAEILECGALDGLSLSEIERLSPAEEEYLLETRLKDGTAVRLSRDKLIPRMQKCIDSLVERGADVILILCLGEWPRFKSDKLVVRALEPFCAFTLGLMDTGDKMGVIVPAEEQVDDFRWKWSKEGVGVMVVAASPYSPTAKDEIARAAEILKDANVVAMACPGYTAEMKRTVQQITGKPVVLVRSALAWMVKELTG